jgi:hypothetical protein
MPFYRRSSLWEATFAIGASIAVAGIVIIATNRDVVDHRFGWGMLGLGAVIVVLAVAAPSFLLSEKDADVDRIARNEVMRLALNRFIEQSNELRGRMLKVKTRDDALFTECARFLMESSAYLQDQVPEFTGLYASDLAHNSHHNFGTDITQDWKAAIAWLDQRTLRLIEIQGYLARDAFAPAFHKS